MYALGNRADAISPDANVRSVPKPCLRWQGSYRRPSSSCSEQIDLDSSPSWRACFYPLTFRRFALPLLPAPSGYELTCLFMPLRIGDS